MIGGDVMSKKVTIYLEDDTYTKISTSYKIRNFRTMSELVETALKEWLAKGMGQEVSGFLSKQLIAQIQSTIWMSEQRLNRTLFKIAVSDTELKHVLVSGFKRIDPDFLDKVADKSLREVRQKNGILDLKAVVEEIEDERERQAFLHGEE